MAYMSQEGYDKLVAELKRLESIEMKNIVLFLPHQLAQQTGIYQNLPRGTGKFDKPNSPILQLFCKNTRSDSGCHQIDLHFFAVKPQKNIIQKRFDAARFPCFAKAAYFFLGSVFHLVPNTFTNVRLL